MQESPGEKSIKELKWKIKNYFIFYQNKADKKKQDR